MQTFNQALFNLVKERKITEKEALARVAELRRAGWFIYRLTGPGGMEMSQEQLDQISQSLPP